MSSRQDRKFTEIVDRVEDIIGADVNRDLLKIAIEDDNVGGIDQNLDQVGGKNQSAIDIAQKIDNLTTLIDALDSVSSDEVRVVSPSALDVSASEVDVDIATQSLSPLTITDDGNFSIAAWNAGTLNVEQQTPVKLEDSQGNTIDPDSEANYPNSTVVGSDLTASSTTLGPFNVEKTQGVFVSANDTSGGTFDISATWVDSNGNVFQNESLLTGVTQDYALLVRKAPQVEITLTNNSSATSVNAYVDAHR